MIGVRARRVDDDAAADLAAVRLHRGDTAVPDGDAGDRRPHLEAYAHAPAPVLVCFGHGVGGHVAVGGTPEHRLDGAEIERPEPLRLGAVDAGRPPGRPARRRPAAAAAPRRAGGRARCGCEPTSCQSGRASGSRCSSRNVWTECMASRTRSTLARTCPQRPAPCAVVTWPTSPARSISRTSRLPGPRQAVGDAAADGAAPDDDDLALGEKAHASSPCLPSTATSGAIAQKPIRHTR